MVDDKTAGEAGDNTAAADEASARVNDFVSKAQEALGEALDGAFGERLDQAHESLGDTIEQVREFSDQLTETARERPLTTLLVVGAVSFALGFLLRR